MRSFTSRNNASAPAWSHGHPSPTIRGSSSVFLSAASPTFSISEYAPNFCTTPAVVTPSTTQTSWPGTTRKVLPGRTPWSVSRSSFAISTHVRCGHSPMNGSRSRSPPIESAAPSICFVRPPERVLVLRDPIGDGLDVHGRHPAATRPRRNRRQATLNGFEAAMLGAAKSDVYPAPTSGTTTERSVEALGGAVRLDGFAAGRCARRDPADDSDRPTGIRCTHVDEEEHQERLAKNKSLFRALNENIRSSPRSWGQGHRTS